ncbi:sulfite exporter TauE/SafE family protein [Kamptonema cortianum]|nr:sulfite exporter TauE/SafE family protein [Kamptonema cortianum]
MTETPLGLSLIFVSGVGAAAINAVAGGGTLISFPTLLAMGLPDRIANATNAVALWPGSASGALGFHKYFQEAKAQIKFLLPSTIIGSILGSILLVVTPEQLFKTFVPFLILAATLLLAFQVRIKKWSMQAEFHLNPWIASLLQFFVALYGGYFGAGMGIMMLAIMSLYVEGDIHRLNAIKNWLAVVINFGASVILIYKGLVSLYPALALMAGAVVGGYFSAKISLKVPAEGMRRAIVVYGFVMVGIMMWRLWA